MKKILLAGLFVIIAACGGANGSDSGTASSPSEGAVEGQRDFTLALADGTSYTLSEADKPAFVIFWAEW
ncbi:hypothetical protein MNBD_ACTINO02-2487 [hydrothermal vent metagenome]|uniref:Uncharacterized protein n=1 Tax=hydrothermal vent metagenome TaxID=652676 RepID=A0A3B0SSR5_9ZZZZ